MIGHLCAFFLSFSRARARYSKYQKYQTNSARAVTGWHGEIILMSSSSSAGPARFAWHDHMVETRDAIGPPIPPGRVLSRFRGSLCVEPPSHSTLAMGNMQHCRGGTDLRSHVLDKTPSSCSARAERVLSGDSKDLWERETLVNFRNC